MRHTGSSVFDRSRFLRVCGAVLAAAGAIGAFVLAAGGAPFWLVFTALMFAWLGVALTNLKIS